MGNKNSISLLYSMLIPALLAMTCTSVMMELESPEEPDEVGILIIGNVIVENINQELDFENWDFPTDVVIIGKSFEGVMNHYTVTTDSRGYFVLPNAPPGVYAIKAVILPLFGDQPVKLVSPLGAGSPEFYRMRHPEEEIDYTATRLPYQSDSRILNLDILWLGLRVADVEGMSRDRIGKILMQGSIESCEHRQFWTEGYVYSRENPLDYLKAKFPDSGWWK
jgi:hypothetical protein